MCYLSIASFSFNFKSTKGYLPEGSWKNTREIIRRRRKSRDALFQLFFLCTYIAWLRTLYVLCVPYTIQFVLYVAVVPLPGRRIIFHLMAGIDVVFYLFIYLMRKNCAQNFNYRLIEIINDTISSR